MIPYLQSPRRGHRSALSCFLPLARAALSVVALSAVLVAGWAQLPAPDAVAQDPEPAVHDPYGVEPENRRPNHPDQVLQTKPTRPLPAITNRPVLKGPTQVSDDREYIEWGLGTAPPPAPVCAPGSPCGSPGCPPCPTPPPGTCGSAGEAADPVAGCCTGLTDCGGVCRACDGGRVCAPANTFCACPGGQVWNPTTSLCCAVGEYYDVVGGTCEACAAGERLVSGRCICNAGLVRDADGNCAACDPPRQVLGGVCDCPGGARWDAGSSSCVCEPPTYDDGAGTCVICAAPRTVQGAPPNQVCECTPPLEFVQVTGQPDRCLPHCVMPKVRAAATGLCECLAPLVPDGRGGCMCPDGQVDDGQGGCRAVCRDDQVWDTGLAACVCPAGQADWLAPGAVEPVCRPDCTPCETRNATTGLCDGGCDECSSCTAGACVSACTAGQVCHEAGGAGTCRDCPVLPGEILDAQHCMLCNGCWDEATSACDLAGPPCICPPCSTAIAGSCVPQCADNEQCDTSGGNPAGVCTPRPPECQAGTLYWDSQGAGGADPAVLADERCWGVVPKAAVGALQPVVHTALPVSHQGSATFECVDRGGSGVWSFRSGVCDDDEACLGQPRRQLVNGQCVCRTPPFEEKPDGTCDCRDGFTWNETRLRCDPVVSQSCDPATCQPRCMITSTPGVEFNMTLAGGRCPNEHWPCAAGSFCLKGSASFMCAPTPLTPPVAGKEYDTSCCGTCCPPGKVLADASASAWECVCAPGTVESSPGVCAAGCEADYLYWDPDGARPDGVRQLTYRAGEAYSDTVCGGLVQAAAVGATRRAVNDIRSEETRAVRDGSADWTCGADGAWAAGATTCDVAAPACPAFSLLRWRTGSWTWALQAQVQHAPPPHPYDWCGAQVPELAVGSSLTLSSTGNNCFGTASECPPPTGTVTVRCNPPVVPGLDPALAFEGLSCSTGSGCPAAPGWTFDPVTEECSFHQP